MNPIVNFSPSVIIEGSKKVNSFFKKTVDSFLGIRYATAKRFAEPKPFVLEGKYLADSYGLYKIKCSHAMEYYFLEPLFFI